MRFLTTSLTVVAVLIVAHLAIAGGIQVDANPAGFSSVNHYGDDMILAMWDLQFSFDLEAATGDLGNAGSEFDGTFYYSTRWAANLIHQLDLAGTLIKEFSIPGVSGLRDLAYDGEYFNGGAAGGTIWKMDFGSETLVSSISGGFQSRAIAYNEDTDEFICSNWGDPVWIVDAATGVITGTFNLVSTTNTYGFAYESQCSGDPTLWVHDQTLGGAVIHQWDLSGAFTGTTHDVAADFPASIGIAGGLWFSRDAETGFGTLGGLLQGTPDMAFGYDLCVGEYLDIDIEPINGTYFQPGDVIEYEVTLTNNTDSPINVTAKAYASNSADWQLTLFGPVNFNIPENTTIGPVALSSQVPNAAPSMIAYICAEANDIHDCYEVTIESGECPSIVGDWTIYYDWNCDGGPGNHNMTFYGDGTFQSSGGFSGIWTQVGCDIEWYYTNGTHYWGVLELDGLFMEGDMLSYSGLDGCWWADRIAAKTLPTCDEQGFSSSGELLMTN